MGAPKWTWASINPGMANLPVPSMISAPAGGNRFGLIWVMRPLETRMWTPERGGAPVPSINVTFMMKNTSDSGKPGREQPAIQRGNNSANQIIAFFIEGLLKRSSLTSNFDHDSTSGAETPPAGADARLVARPSRLRGKGL